jgi:hypothetical protein
MEKVDILRKKYPRFIYKDYYWEVSRKDLKISFDFIISPDDSTNSPQAIKFNPKIVLRNIDEKRIKRVGERILNNFVFNLGLVELLSYWKATCSPEIVVGAGYLNEEQIKWWKDLINRGMSQFFYENRIDFTRSHFFKIIPQKSIRFQKYEKKLASEIMIPLGGGKDSIVTLEILKKNAVCFSLNPTDTVKQIIKISGCRNPIFVERRIDEKLLELNRKGFLNGHTPFSAYLAFLSSLLAVIFDTKYIAFANERSSNEGNVKYLGKIINHQYSKSFDFEQKFRKYSKKYLAKDLEYFSFLRPLYEIQIARLFSKYPKYFDIFLSCNEALKTYSGSKKPTGRWCGKCPKCLFVFMILYSFIKRDKLVKIFSQNLFEKKELVPLILELIGERKFKPFECVGTRKESLIALYLGWKKEKAKPPFLLKCFEKKIMLKHPNLEKEAKNMMNSWNKENNLTKSFKNIMKK